MTLREVVIGLDIGTTSVKAVLFDTKGKLILETEELITTFHPEPGWAEQDPKETERKAIQVIKQAINQLDKGKDKLLGIGFSSAMHSLICMSSDKEPLSNVIIWSDGRSSEQAENLNEVKGKDIYLRTGTPIHPMSPFVKLNWMKETGYEPYHQAAYFLSMKEYLVWKWFDKRLTDYAMASATGLYNVQTHHWDEEALEIVGVSQEQLSEIVGPDTVLGGLIPEVANEIGVSSELPFVIGSADGQLANLGDGAILPGEVAISAGTSGAIRQFAQGAAINSNRETFTYAFTRDTSIVGGPTNNGGVVLQWLKDVLEFKGTHEELIAGAETIAPGAEGILFLPYVNGERAPVWNQRARGNFYGLSIEHRKEHLVRAVLEGIALNLYQISQSLEKLAGEPKRITVNGGLSKSDVWVQIVADIFGKEIHQSETHHSAAWGAAWTALVGIGYVSDYAAIKEYITIKKSIQPNLENHKKYAKNYEKYARLAKDISTYFTD
ncbi:gluconokinase [Aquibacillus albus]|uniref:Gluconokinase n=1 Tax=Aquibacillus albus TaxID=1168171 RepID=A0ABS2N3B6_9BACI|nr:gluconokinase [Aquibacillus albus]MBM7572636.1 gluconokinase [Aquibacillus albus]